MKRLTLSILLACCAATSAFAQAYQPQYPSDPYNTIPQPSPSASYSPPPSSRSSSGYDALLSYGYLQAAYSFNSFSNFSGLDGGSGVKADLGVQLFKPAFLHFSVDWLRGTLPGTSFHMTSLSAGGGVYIPVTDRFHIFGEVGVRYDVVQDADIITLGKDDFSVYIRPGIRFAATDRIELQADMTFNSTSNLNDRVFGLSAYFAMIGPLDLEVGMDFSSDVNSYFGGLRWRW